MMFHLSKIIPQQVANKAVVATTTRSLATLATTTTATEAVVLPETNVVVEDSFAFYPVQKNRVKGTYNPNNQEASSATINRECFSYYPTNGNNIDNRTTVAKTKATTTKATILDVASKTENDMIISKDEWRSVIQERLMKNHEPVSTPIVATASSTTIDDSFAFYPVQSNRVTTTQNVVVEEARECFSFYPSNGGVKHQEKKNAVEVEEEEKVHNFADGVPSHVKDHVKTAEFFGVEKKGSFEDSTPSPTDWESITIMQALKNVESKTTTTTFAVAP